jgi:hypothetical protein
MLHVHKRTHPKSPSDMHMPLRHSVSSVLLTSSVSAPYCWHLSPLDPSYVYIAPFGKYTSVNIWTFNAVLLLEGCRDLVKYSLKCSHLWFWKSYMSFWVNIFPASGKINIWRLTRKCFSLLNCIREHQIISRFPPLHESSFEGKCRREKITWLRLKNWK